ncbi:hypothetical protein [Solibacillus sp. CAU 1738]|uniref:hypothetical protein n=1 Tax=Solibacillus sp. CAU 1738 TaxID=3140363 RepID=UPI00326083CA
MEDVIIVIGIMALIVSIPLVAIVTAHKRSAMKLQLQIIEKETELEKIKMENYGIETEKMRVELEHSKQALLEMKK